tara:strand:+ start:140 stop:556 length:417 start_codon:yes stop_codon:yes gene_type:complete
MPIPSQLLKQRKAYLKKNGTQLRDEGHDCTVVALAIATGASYAEAYEEMRRVGRKTGRGFFMQGSLQIVLARFGFKAVEVRLEDVKGKTTKTIQLPRENKHLVFVRRHVLAVQFGLVRDWSGERALRIKRVFRIEEIK